MKNAFRSLAAGILSAVALALAVPAQAQSSLDRILKEKKLRVTAR